MRNEKPKFYKPVKQKRRALGHTYTGSEEQIAPDFLASNTISQYNHKINRFNSLDVITKLNQQIQAVKSGDLSCAEEMLVSQAYTLDTIFNKFMIIAGRDDTGFSNAEIFFRLALKAQKQSRATWQTLAEIKNPQPAAFIKQQNIAMNQQVNNEVSLGKKKIINQSNELLEKKYERMDKSTAKQALTGNSSMAAMAVVNRREND